MVEVAGVEPASYRVSIKSATSLVPFFRFCRGCWLGTASPRNTSERLARVVEAPADQPDLYDTFSHVSGKPMRKRLLLVIRQRVPNQQVDNLRCLQLKFAILLFTWPGVSTTACSPYFH